MAREVEPLIVKLKEEGKNVWSISRLNTFNQCKLAYKYGYVDKVKGIDNVYNLLGTFAHDNKELMLNKSITREEFLNKFNDLLFDLEMREINFPDEKIKNSYINNMKHYIMNHEEDNSKCIIEKFIIYKVDEDNYLQGFIDCINMKDGKLRIIDFKTSSKYSGDAKIDAGRQLVFYKEALEYNSGRKVDYIGWDMLKYCNVCTTLKNGNIKEYFIERQHILKEMRDRYFKDMLEIGMDEFEINMVLDEGKEIPDILKHKYWIKDGLVEYEWNDTVYFDTLGYIRDSIKAIQEEVLFEPIEINKKTSFYCSQLCSYRKVCYQYKKYMDDYMESVDR